PPSPVPEEALPDVELILFTVPPEGDSARMTLVLEEAPERPSALRAMVRDRVDADPAWSARWTVDEIRVSGDGRLVELVIVGDPDLDAALELADPPVREPFRWPSPD